MDRLIGIIRQIAAVALFVALAFAPAVNAVTHGTATVVAEADDAAHFAEQAHYDRDHTHGQHNTADHDHMASVILPAGPSLAAPQGRDTWPLPIFRAAGRDDSRLQRPPRA